MRRPTRALPFLLAAMFLPTAAHAQNRQELLVHERKCKEVATAFMKAMDAGDAAALRDLIYYDGGRVSAQAQGLAAFVDCVVQQRALEAALIEKFGAAAAAMATGDDENGRFTQADYDAVKDARLEIREGEAVLILGPTVSPIVFQRRERSKERDWKVVLRPVTTLYNNQRGLPEPGSQRRIEDMRAAARAVGEVTAQVRAGAFATADAAATALQAALEREARAKPAK